METSAATEIADIIFSHTQSNGDSSATHIWDIPWSTDEIRKYSQSWSLAGDAGLLNKLQDMAQNLVSKTHQVQQEMNGLVAEAAATHARLHNAVNDFLMLSNIQFVESRVYDEEVHDSVSSENKKEERSKEERDSEIISKVAEALRLGMSVIDIAYEQLELQNSDSEEEVEPYGHEPLLHPKDPYSDRSLPCIIGSQKFMEDDHLGLGGSASEEEMANEVSSISSEEHVLPRINSLDKKSLRKLEDEVGKIDKDYESEASRSSDMFNQSDKDDVSAPDNNVNDSFLSTRVNLEKELAAKLKPHEKLSYDDESSMSSSSFSDDAKKTSTKRRKKRLMPKPSVDHLNESSHHNLAQKLETSDISDSKPAVLHKNNMLQSALKEKIDDDDDGDLFREKKLFSKKKGGLFDDDEDAEDNLFLGSKNLTSLENDDQQDLFMHKSAKKKINTEASTSHEKVSRNLFGDSNFFADDDKNVDKEDLFAVVTSKKGDKIKVITRGMEFDKDKGKYENDEEEELFQKKQDSKNSQLNKKKILAGAVSSLGSAGVNPSIFRIPQHSKESDESDEVASITPSISNKSLSLHDERKGSPSNSGSSSSTAWFAEEPEVDDLFSAPNASESKRTHLGGISFSGSNDEEDIEDIFAIKPKALAPFSKTSGTSTDSESQVVQKVKTRTMFDANDSDDHHDLFSSSTKATTSSLQNNGDRAMKNSLTQTKNVPQIKPSHDISLFDDDGDTTEDLFKEILPSISAKSRDRNIITAKSKPSESNLFEDEELLFGSAPPDNPEVDLFGSISKPIKMKDEAKHPETKKTSGEMETQSVMSKTELHPSLFDEDDDDLFGGVSKLKKNREKLDSPLSVSTKEMAVNDLDISRKEDETLVMQQDALAKEDLPVRQVVTKVANVVESPRKKPVGGKLMFGGILPPLLKQPRALSPVQKLHPESVENQGAPVSPLRDAFILPPSGIVKSPVNEVAVSFDDPVEANPLHSTNKDRIKIQVKRRPPTRRGRQEALRRSAVDMINQRERNDMLDAIDKRTTVSAPTSPISPDVQVVEGFPYLATETNKLSVDSARITSIASPSTEEEDLFSVGDPIAASFTGHGSSFEHVSPASVLVSGVSPKKGSEGKDLFGGSSDDGETDELFKPQPKARTTVRSKNLSPKLSPKQEHKLAGAPDKIHGTKEEHDSVSTGNSSVLPELDLDHNQDKKQYSASTTLPSKNLAEESIHHEQHPPPSNPSKKIQGRLDSSKRPKSLFDDDDDDDDLFKTSSVVPHNVKPAGRSATASTKKTDNAIRQTSSSQLKNNEDNLFEDPLMGNKN